jgi:hypothetical protein
LLPLHHLPSLRRRKYLRLSLVLPSNPDLFLQRACHTSRLHHSTILGHRRRKGWCYRLLLRLRLQLRAHAFAPDLFGLDLTIDLLLRSAFRVARERDEAHGSGAQSPVFSDRGVCDTALSNLLGRRCENGWWGLWRGWRHGSRRDRDDTQRLPCPLIVQILDDAVVVGIQVQAIMSRRERCAILLPYSRMGYLNLWLWLWWYVYRCTRRDGRHVRIPTCGPRSCGSSRDGRVAKAFCGDGVRYRREERLGAFVSSCWHWRWSLRWLRWSLSLSENLGDGSLLCW